MPIGVRALTVLGEFKPFGLIAEVLDGKRVENVTDNYNYFLFDPNLTKAREETYLHGASSENSDHELFIRGDRIIWTAGSRVYKRFSLPSPVIMACWSRLGVLPEAALCVLQIKTLTVFNTSGEVVSIPLPHAVTSIWPLPFGLLLEQENEGNLLTPTSSSSSPLFSQSDLSSTKCDIGHSPLHKFNLPNLCGHVLKTDGTSVSSHFILKDPLEEPQLIFVEERGKLNVMKDFDERTIWTSDCIPLMATYNNGKMQHTLWSVEIINSNIEVANADSAEFIPDGVLPKKFSSRRIWQAKGAQTAASKVFLATDEDSIPIVCFLLQEQKRLLSVRLQSVEINNDIIFDIQPDISWSIAATAAAPVIVTRPSVKWGQLPFTDVIALASDNSLLLYSGKQCLCRFSLPSCLHKLVVPHGLNSSETASSFRDLKIIGLSDAVGGRVNVIANNGQMFRCALHRSPSFSLANDCITALAEGLCSDLYMHFLIKLWADGDLACPSKVDSSVDLEWESLSNVMLQMCRHLGYMTKKASEPVLKSSWQFLINSKFHENYSQPNGRTRVSSAILLDNQEPNLSGSHIDDMLSLEKPLYSKILRESLDSLHAVYETLKLDNLRKRDLGLLVLLLSSIADCLHDESYLDHYIRDFPALSTKLRLQSASLSLRPAPCLFRWLDNCMQGGSISANINDLPPLVLEDRKSVISWARKIVAFYSILFGAKQLGKKLSSGVYCNIASGSFSTLEELTVLTMVGENFGLQHLDLLPAGVSLPLRHALDKCRESPPTDWPAAAYVLLGREDLALSCLTHLSKFNDLETGSIVNLISQSTPYMLHLHTVTVPSATSDAMGLENSKFEDAASTDGSLMDGMEHIFNSSTQLRYGQDLRLNEVRRVLCSARPVAIQTPVNPTASDQDLQQAQLWQLAQRTTALPFGRGAFTVATVSTLLMEAFTVPTLVLAGRLPAQQNATVNLDPDMRNLQEVKSWAEFNNAVAAGLRLAPFQEKMSRTWIMYNKPEEPNAIHAGLLLALGLHGFLHVLSITDIYQYLAQEHECTSAGLMLGLAASYRGTMQPSISKSLYFHIPARHPSSFPELEVPTLLQSAALVSLGLLFEGSAHAQTLQILLDEIGRRSGGDNVLEKEGYAVSAGFSLGLVGLGRGEVAVGFMGTLVNRLLQYVGSKELHSENSLHSLPVDELHCGAGQIMDTNPVNVDVTAPGALIALALLFLKTDSEVIVSRLPIPSTHFELQYVRPDFIMLRVIARNLILWHRVHASEDWVWSQVPEIIKDGVKSLSESPDDVDEMHAEAFFQAYINIVVGACISIGLIFAGTKDANAQELLYDYAVYFLNEIKPVSNTKGKNFPRGLSRYADRGTLEIFLHFIVLSLSVVMAGSGHLQTFRLLRFLRNRSSADGHTNYGIQLAVSLAIGFLFLGGGMRTFSTNNSSIAALLITLYPRLPTAPNDNRCHLQAFRHLYVLATEARWIQTIDVSTGLPVYAPLEVTIRETEHYAETSFCEVSPCILPERAILKAVRVCGPRYWPQVIELVPEDKSWWRYGDKNDPFNSGILYIKRKVGVCSYIDDPIGRQSLISQLFGLTSVKTCMPSAYEARQSKACSATVGQLVSKFSSDPSLTAFSQLFCDPSWCNGSDVDFQEFCLQVLFECVSKDKPPLLQVYLSLYTTIGSMADQITNGTATLGDSLFISSLKLALTYNDALLSGRLASSDGGIVQSAFLGSLRKRVELLLNYSQRDDLFAYTSSSRWPRDHHRSVLLSWYLQWFGVPPPGVVQGAVEKIKPRLADSSSSVPLLRLLLPRTHLAAINDIHGSWFASRH